MVKMKNRVKKIALIITILLSAEITFSISTSAEKIYPLELQQTITVDKNGKGDYASIQEAIDNSIEGSIIYVKTGEYPEIINVDKKMSLIGENKDNTIINPISTKNKYAIRLGASDVTLKGFSITNGAPGLYTQAIRISSPDTEIQDCNIHDTPVGIVIWTSNNIVDNCEFWGCEDEGIALIGTTYTECNNNKITSCLFYENCDGIELQRSSNNIIQNCDFYDNTHSGIDAIVSSNNQNIIIDCRIYDNEVHGIFLSSSSDNLIKNCIISNNDDGNVITAKNSENNVIEYGTKLGLTDKQESSIKSRISLLRTNIISRLMDILSKFNTWELLSNFISYNF